MKDWILAATVTVIVVIQSMVAVLVNYPPTEEQLRLLSWFSLNGYLSLWMLRLISLIVLFLIFKIWKELVDRKIYQWSLIVLLMSPAIFALWYLFPLYVLKILLVMIFLYFYQKISRGKTLLVGLIVAFVICFNRFVLLDKAAVFNKLSFKDAQNEVTSRFVSEDSLLDKIELPLWWRRVAYNKYFFVYKQVLAEVLPFFDLETLFFQEMPPTEQKSMVMWFWPEVYVLIFGIYFWTKKKERKANSVTFVLFFISLVDFVFSEGSSYLRMITTMWPLSIVIGIGFENLILLTKNKYGLAKFGFGLMVFLLILSFGFNFYDLNNRKEYWFDNRPLAFQFWFENIKKVGVKDFQKIYVSSLVGDSKKYCYFYFGQSCNDIKWIFKSFDLSKENPTNKTIYAGFAGEFVGPKFKNDISSDWKNTVELKNMYFVGVRNLRDTIANQYGNDVAIVVNE